MLPPTTTALLQPFGVGIVRNFKSVISKKKALYNADRLNKITRRVKEAEQEIVERWLEAIGNVDTL